MTDTQRTPIFLYGDAETRYLKDRDPVLGRIIDEVGPIRRPVIPDLFEALINSIAGQQISSKALATVWQRITDRCSPLTPEHLLLLPAEELQNCGISLRKASYIKEAAARIVDGRLDLHALTALSDDEVSRVLCELPGVGPWTAQMLMIFSMQRPDVLSYGDFGIRKGLRMIYGHREITSEQFSGYKRLYSPCATVASLYLWAVAGGAVPDLEDPAPKKGGKS